MVAVTEGNTQFRLSVVGIVVMALFSALFARLWFLQIAESSNLAQAATSNRVRVVNEPAIRGRILDARGRPLVQNRVVEAITFDRSERLEREERDVVVGRLAELLGTSSEMLDEQIDDPRISPFAPVPVAVDVPSEAITYVREHQEEFPAVAAERLTIREYPHGRLASHVLGYIGEISREELEAREGEGYQQGDQIGKAGVEQMFESVLRGQPRVQRLEVDSQGRVVGAIEERAAVPGNDVQLTIDLDIQRIAEESLAQGMEGAQGIRDLNEESTYQTYQATAGSVTVLNPDDGSVVAMASAPDFDPAQLASGVDPEVLEQFQQEESNFPLLNRAVQGQYAPGSTFKLISGLAALESDLITPQDTILDEGCIMVAELEFCNAGDREHGPVDLARALTVSSDVYFYEIGRDMWQVYTEEVNVEGGAPDQGYANQDMAREFGFGTPTGLGLPGEAEGRIPDQAFKEDFNATNPDLEQRRVNSLWLPGDSVILSVGQGDLLVTPIQLANAYATFANGGTQHTPRLARAILEPGTGSEEGAPLPAVVRELPAQEVSQIDLPPEVRDPIMAGLAGVTTSADGTASAAFDSYRGQPVAGKTGTAEVVGKQDTSLFVGMMPAGAPQYVALAIVEQGGFGSAVAAPIVRRVLDALNGDLDPAPVVVHPPEEDDE